MTKVYTVLLLNLGILTAISFGILSIFHEQLGIYQHNWYWWALGCFTGVTTLLFAWLGNKSRKIWNNHVEVMKENEGFKKI